MRLIYCLITSFAIGLLAACGGGGGSAGTSSGGSSGGGTGTGGTPTPAKVATLAVGLSGGGASISVSGSTVQALVKDSSGTAVAGKLVRFTGDSALVKFSPSSGQVLTDGNGIASIQISPASISSVGAGTIEAQATVGEAALLTSFDIQLSASNLALQDLNLGTSPLAAFGNRPISVRATVNGSVASNIPVQVTFGASCGTVEPATVTTDAFGSASTTYKANVATCAGTNVTINAASVGASTVSGVIPVAGAIASNVQFVSPTPNFIYLDGSVGITQAQVVFRVVDSLGNPLQNKKLRLSLSNSATGVSLNEVGNSAPVDLTTDSLGQVSAAVFSGTVPTSLNVRAVLLDGNNEPTLVASNSNVLTVAIGRPVQRSLSLAVEKFSIEGGTNDGASTRVDLAMADRQGNPVPPGTQVNFVAESGVLLPPVCVVADQSKCSVTFISQGTRTANGRVSVLAYVVGEEDFVDVNGNNIFDVGIDSFTDLGRAFRDDNGSSLSGMNGIYDLGEFQVPRIGTGVCTAGGGCPGDGVWGAADVRAQATVVFATVQAAISSSSLVVTTDYPGSNPLTKTLTSLDVTVADLNGNSLATGSTVVVSTVDDGFQVPGFLAGAECTVTSTSNFTVANALGPKTIPITLKGCTATDKIKIRVVSSPSGFVTERVFNIVASPTP